MYGRLHIAGRSLRSNLCNAADNSKPSYEFTYQGSDGRLKATFEQAFKARDPNLPAAETTAAPWSLSYQMAEKNVVWNAALKAGLLKKVAAYDIGITDHEMEETMRRLQTLLPDIENKLPHMKATVLGSLVANIDLVALSLLQLKEIFPGANVSLLAVRQPFLVLGFDMNRLQVIAKELQSLLPNLDIDRLVEAEPSILDIDGFKEALEEAKRIMPELDIQMAMAREPQQILSFQRGNALIPYDPPEPTADRDDDEYSAYYNNNSL